MGLKRINANVRLLSGAATGLALMATASPAFAQSEEVADDAANEIVVSGIRSSIETSLEAKRDATSIVEVISAEDLGQLPDLSIADSLARLPGVTAQRVRGRSQQISIRGLGPDFSLALLNGREVVSAGNNRGIEFDQFPSELVAQGVVYKTADAQLAAIGIAGAVDLRTVRPLDYTDRQLTVSGTFVHNDSGKLNPDFSQNGYRFFGSYIDQNDAGTLGWSLGVTVQSNPTNFISRELKTRDNLDNNAQVRETADGVHYPADNPRQGVVSREFERTSIAGSLQFEPTDDFSLMIDGFYTDTQDSGIFRGSETPIASWGNGGTVQVSNIAGSGPFADSATYTSVAPILRTDTEGNEAQIFAIGANVDFGITDSLSFMVDYGYSTLDRDDIDYESYAGTGSGSANATPDTLNFTFPTNGEYTIDTLVDYTDPANILLIDPGGWGQVGFIKRPIINDELHQLRAEATYEFGGGLLDNVQFGWLYTDREKDFDSNEAFLRASPAFTGGEAPVPASAIIGATNSGDLGFDILAYDPSSLLTDGTYTVEPATFDNEWVVGEEVHNLYIQANINGDIGNIPVRGNFGLRYAHTEQTSTGTIGNGLNNTVSESYSDWLPSMNLSFEVGTDTFIRLAAAKTVTRARLDQLAANQSISTNPMSCTDTDADQFVDTLLNFNPPSQVCFSVNGGNPFLQPYESLAFDASFEKYFSPGTAVILAVFHKDLSDWVVDGSTLTDLTQQIDNSGNGAFLDANPQVATGFASGPTNFAEGSITRTSSAPSAALTAPVARS